MLSLFAQMKATALASMLWAEATPARRYSLILLALLASMAPALLMSDERAIFLTHDRPFAGYAGFGPVRWHDVRYGYGHGPGGPGNVAGPPGGLAPPPGAGRPGLPGLPAAPALPFIGFAGVPDGLVPPDGLLPFGGPGAGNPLGAPPGSFSGTPITPDGNIPPGGSLVSSVPEPATWMTMLAGLVAVGLMLRRRRAPVPQGR
jgi:hypothetical protein